MSSDVEPITIYSLMVGESGRWTIGDADEASHSFSDSDLQIGWTLLSVFGMGNMVAFGEEDMRSLRMIRLAMPVISLEIERRAGVPLQVNTDAIWRWWCDEVSTDGEYARTIPIHRLIDLRDDAILALKALGDRNDADAAFCRQGLKEADQAISSLMLKRGISLQPDIDSTPPA